MQLFTTPLLPFLKRPANKDFTEFTQSLLELRTLFLLSDARGHIPGTYFWNAIFQSGHKFTVLTIASYHFHHFMFEGKQAKEQRREARSRPEESKKSSSSE